MLVDHVDILLGELICRMKEETELDVALEKISGWKLRKLEIDLGDIIHRKVKVWE